ncbi:MAG: hypothetical protein E5W75_28875 [Mesorhizobium sp.]|nr:MAG: hypothetical protein E5W75_28875 [Mesorhizobium sp.]
MPAAYHQAHPGKISVAAGARKTRHVSLIVPDFGDDKQNAALDRAINEFIQKVTSITGKSG